jgi:DNA invertase Pin-like site-specific DNA recombinase
MTVSRTPRVLIYARISTATKDAGGKGQDPQLQLDELRAVAAQRGWQIVGEFVDIGISGAKERRPQLDALMKEVHRGRADVVAVWKFDRFARSVGHLVRALDDFRARGVHFFSARDSIDTSTPAGRFTFAVIAAVAELERELIRERTVAGLAAARRRGVRLGRKPVRVDVDRARELRSHGLSYRQLAAELGVSVGVVHRLLNEDVHLSSTAEASDLA